MCNNEYLIVLIKLSTATEATEGPDVSNIESASPIKLLTHRRIFVANLESSGCFNYFSCEPALSRLLQVQFIFSLNNFLNKSQGQARYETSQSQIKIPVWIYTTLDNLFPTFVTMYLFIHVCA